MEDGIQRRLAKIARREAGGAVEQFPGTVCNRL
jgi:hypothetical protein